MKKRRNNILFLGLKARINSGEFLRSGGYRDFEKESKNFYAIYEQKCEGKDLGPSKLKAEFDFKEKEVKSFTQLTVRDFCVPEYYWPGFNFSEVAL